MRKRLARYGLPEPILAAWEKRYGGYLLPLQQRAIEEYRLLDGDSLLISAPTSSGKTFCGEMALMRAIQQRQKALFLVPLKAVAEEKFRQFSDCYGSIGLSVVIGTRDYPEYDADIENGKFDIAVMVYEKFNSLLLANFDLMSQVGTIVVDELQMLEDDSRGARLELALAKLRYSMYRPQIVGLSAVLGEASEPAGWLGGRLLLEKARPVELHRGIAADGVFSYRCHNTGVVGEEECLQEETPVGTLFENIRREYEAGRGVLVFLKSRAETMRAAMEFCEFAGLAQERSKREFFIDCLADEEESSLLDNLFSVTACGVAFHNADLTIGQRAAVEDGYRKGLVQVIFATTTLSTGINLPASTVFIEAQKYNSPGYTGQAGMEPLNWAEYESMSGRAGRVGMADEGAGKAVLFASSDLEKSILWEYYIDKQPAALRSRLAEYPREDAALDIIVSQLAHSVAEIDGVLDGTYARLVNGHTINIQEETIKALVEGGFVSRDGESLSPLPLGEATAMTGLSVAGAAYILSGWDVSSGQSDEELLFGLLRCPDAGQLYIPRNSSGGRVQAPERHIIADSPLLRKLSRMRRELTDDEIRRAGISFLLFDWISGVAPLEIENDYRLHPGMVGNLARRVGWLLSSAAGVIGAADRHARSVIRLNRLAFAVGHGAPYEMKEIANALPGLLYRRELLELHRQDITTVEALLGEGQTIVGRLVSSESRLKKITETLQHIKENAMRSNRHDAMRDLAPQSIEIDGTPIRERFRVRINGQTINLTGKSFKYLCRLAWSRITNDGGWLYKEELEQGFNQARYLYRLRQEIGKDFLPGWPLYENNRSGYYRLVAPADGITLNLDMLKNNPDFEVRQIVGDMNPQQMTQ
ncbi:MAG: DEAD/DEAH box helicase [Candidatus Zixiibacteriota bacterium]